jgi:hypothetical protein
MTIMTRFTAFSGHSRKGQPGRKGVQLRKLNPRDIKKIRELYHAGKATQATLADMYDTSQANISYIVRNKTKKFSALTEFREREWDAANRIAAHSAACGKDYRIPAGFYGHLIFSIVMLYNLFII